MFKKFVSWLQKIQIVVGTFFLTIFLLAIICQIVTRYLKISVLWTEEVANFSFIWAIFTGAAIMVRENQHFSFTYLVERATGNKKKYLSLTIFTIMLIFTLSTCYYGINLTETFWDYNWNTLPDFKMGYIWMTLPFNMAAMSLYIVEHIIEVLKGTEDEKGVVVQ